MDKKKNIYEPEVMALPPLRLVVGNIPSPDPDWHNKSNPQSPNPSRELKSTVKRLIAHLEEEQLS